MQGKDHSRIVGSWVKGWSLAREVALPVAHMDGFRIDVGWPQQLKRYVFPAIGSGFLQLADTIFSPWIFLKVCAGPDEVGPLLPDRWAIQPPGFMMRCSGAMNGIKKELPEGYILELNETLPVPVASIMAPGGELAAIGRVAIVDDFAIYDRIETHQDHRRRGLAGIIMKTLETTGSARGAKNGILVATGQGKALYESLGWDLYSLYTSAVIAEVRG